MNAAQLAPPFMNLFDTIQAKFASQKAGSFKDSRFYLAIFENDHIKYFHLFSYSILNSE